MFFISESITVSTKGFFDITDLTDIAENFLDTHSAHNGLLNVYTTHTTTAIKINETEEGFFADLKKVVSEELFSPQKEYHHNNLERRDPATLCPINGEECLNGHSHISQMFLGSASETIPVCAGKPQWGRWQRLLFLELDHARERTVIFSFTGEKNTQKSSL